MTTTLLPSESTDPTRSEGWLVDEFLSDVVPSEDAFFPEVPKSIEETGLAESRIEALLLKFLLHRGSATAAQAAEQIKLPFALVSEMSRRLKDEQIVAYRRSVGLADYELQLTDTGAAQARRYSDASTYFGSAPVPYETYLRSVDAQSPSRLNVGLPQLRSALAKLSISDPIVSRLGQAITAGRALFLYGQPGNGKTSIAEQLSMAYGPYIWIPRAIEFDGEIVRLFDPIVHKESRDRNHAASAIDQRWVRIVRPTIIAGGELQMHQLEIVQNEAMGICEAPMQLKSNCGVLVIDDFGRQRMDPTELLNRWIVPLEKRYDFLNLPSGKKIQIPFDQLLVFSTKSSAEGHR